MKIQLWFRVTSLLVFLNRARRIVDIQLYHSFAAYYHWIHSPRFRNRRTRHGSEAEAPIQAAPGSLSRIGLADRGSDRSRIYYFEHGQPGDRMGASTACHGHLWNGDRRNLHVDETRLSL